MGAEGVRPAGPAGPGLGPGPGPGPRRPALRVVAGPEGAQRCWRLAAAGVGGGAGGGGGEEEVLYFPGDGVPAPALPEGSPARALCAVPAQCLAVLVAFERARGPSARIGLTAVVPSREEGLLACFDHFLPSCSLSGEPGREDPVGGGAAALRAAGQSAAVLRGASASARGPVHVVGFSKGGAVVTQLLRECARRRASAPGGGADRGGSLLDRVESFSYVDSGLNTRGKGAYLTDPKVAAALAAGGGGPRVELHGTARQWRCTRRPWLGEEARECFGLLRGAGAPVSALFYEMGGRADLAAHLELLQDFRPGGREGTEVQDGDRTGS